MLQVHVAGGAPGGPSSRGLHSLTALDRHGSSLFLFGGAPQSGPMVRLASCTVAQAIHACETATDIHGWFAAALLGIR